jgi:hypothetical protein
MRSRDTHLLLFSTAVADLMKEEEFGLVAVDGGYDS